MEWARKNYNDQYEKWMPWVEDVYLRWFTKDNKASYTAKENLDKSKVTGVEQVDTLQDGINNLAAGQVGQGGLLQSAGDATSKEGFTRAERQGKDDKGGYAPANLPGADAATEGIKGAGSYVGGMLGGGADDKNKK